MFVQPQAVILTGMSGAGKSVAMQALEDVGFFCVDNLPPALIPRLLDMAEQASGNLNKVAFACDLRGGALFEPLLITVEELRKHKEAETMLVFLDADEATLIRRYKETRRRHPMSPSARLTESIQRERVALSALRDVADIVIDTSAMTTSKLKLELTRRFQQHAARIPVHVLSFGFKYGVPLDADMVFDVRFLPNPHYIDELRPFTGEDQPVYDYVMNQAATRQFVSKVDDMLDFLLPQFQREGKAQLVVGIGCTGGKHRSVAIARHVANHLRQTADVDLIHRDRGREV